MNRIEANDNFHENKIDKEYSINCLYNISREKVMTIPRVYACLFFNILMLFI